MVILSILVKFGQDAFGSSRLVPKWHRNHVNYVKNWSKLAKVHLELAGSYQMDMVILMILVKLGQDAFGSSRLVPNGHGAPARTGQTHDLVTINLCLD